MAAAAARGVPGGASSAAAPTRASPRTHPAPAPRPGSRPAAPLAPARPSHPAPRPPSHAEKVGAPPHSLRAAGGVPPPYRPPSPDTLLAAPRGVGAATSGDPGLGLPGAPPHPPGAPLPTKQQPALQFLKILFITISVLFSCKVIQQKLLKHFPPIKGWGRPPPSPHMRFFISTIKAGSFPRV